jgi:hypothetical protein
MRPSPEKVVVFRYEGKSQYENKGNQSGQANQEDFEFVQSGLLLKSKTNRKNNMRCPEARVKSQTQYIVLFFDNSSGTTRGLQIRAR